jgi:hypothetical protein
MVITQDTTQSDPAIGNHKLINLIYNSDNVHSGCNPYLAFGANSAHGNTKPIALLDTAGNHRSHLKFKEAIMDTDGQSIAVAWLVLVTSGWSDNVTRMVQLDIGRQMTIPQFAEKEWWNWNVTGSDYYPGSVITFWNTDQLQSSCGIHLPTLSFSNTYVGSGGSASSISTYDVDLYSVINCIAHHSGWGGVTNQLPDPIIVSHVEWALETPEINFPHNWIAIWSPTIQ